MRKEKGEYTYPFPRPSVTTDCVIFGYDGKDLKLLLVERGIPPFKGMMRTPSTGRNGSCSRRLDCETPT